MLERRKCRYQSLLCSIHVLHCSKSPHLAITEWEWSGQVFPSFILSLFMPTADGQKLVCSMVNSSAQILKMPLSGKGTAFVGRAYLTLLHVSSKPHNAIRPFSFFFFEAFHGFYMLLVLGHNGSVSMSAWSHSGQYLLTSCEDKTSQLWSLGCSDPLMTFRTVNSNIVVDRESNHPGSKCDKVRICYPFTCDPMCSSSYTILQPFVDCCFSVQPCLSQSRSVCSVLLCGPIHPSYMWQCNPFVQISFGFCKIGHKEVIVLLSSFESILSIWWFYIGLNSLFVYVLPLGHCCQCHPYKFQSHLSLSSDTRTTTNTSWWSPLNCLRPRAFLLSLPLMHFIRVSFLLIDALRSISDSVSLKYTCLASLT